MSRLLNNAVAFAERGHWSVFPLTPGSKRPLPGSSGLHDATDNPDIIRQAWAEHPNANIGIATGEPSGIVVVDIDDWTPVADLEDQYGPLLGTTLTASTPSGGAHLYFARPDGGIRNSASKLAPGIDIRGDGGYVVAPPSAIDGTEYEWTDRSRPAPLPDWIVQALADPPTPASTPPTLDGGGDAFGRKVLHEEIARVAVAPEGTRNDTLFRAAANVFEIVKGGHADKQSAWEALRTAGLRSGLPSRETEATLDSAWERTDPRDPKTPLRTDQQPDRQPQPVVNQPAAEPDAGFLTYSDLTNIRPPDWLVDGVLPEGVTVVYGEANVGKSVLALDWSLAVAAAGRQVVYCLGEGAPGITPRMEAWCDAHPQHDPLPRFHVAADSAKGQQFPSLLDPQSVERFRQRLTSMPEPPGLVVIDTWARALAGGEENHASDVYRAIRPLDGLVAEFGLSILILHHEGRSGHERGSTALKDAVDAMWRLKEDDGGMSDDRLLWCDKMRAFEKPRRPRQYQIVAWPPSIVVSPSAGGKFHGASYGSPF